MKLEVLLEGSPELRKISDEVDLSSGVPQDIVDLAEAMIQTVIADEGVGLSAPQIGRNVCLIVVKRGASYRAFINPVITKAKGSSVMEEGCLSCPNIFGPIKRAKQITVKAFKLNGKSIRIRATAQDAHIFQHEIDHLAGVLIKDFLV